MAQDNLGDIRFFVFCFYIKKQRSRTQTLHPLIIYLAIYDEILIYHNLHAQNFSLGKTSFQETK